MHRLTAACAALVLLLPSAAPATKLVAFPALAVDDRTDPAALRIMNEALYAELARIDEVSLIKGSYGADPADRRGGVAAAQQARATKLRVAADHIRRGRAAAERLRFAKAIIELEEGVGQMTRHIAGLEDHGQLVDAHLLLAIAHLRRGRQSPGLAALEAVVTLDPAYELEQGRYPPLFVTMFAQTKERVLGQTRGRLEVTSDEPGAWVWVNGRRAGVAPMIVDGLVPGANHVVVRLPDGRARGAVVEIVSAAQVTYDVSFDAKGALGAARQLRAAVADNRFDGAAARWGVRVAKEVGADFVALFAMGRGVAVYGVSGLIGDVRTGQWARLTVVEPDLELLSAAIGAHTLAMDIGLQLGSLSSPIGGEVEILPLPRAPEHGVPRAQSFVASELTNDSNAAPAVALAAAAVVPGPPALVAPTRSRPTELLVPPADVGAKPQPVRRVAAVDPAGPSMLVAGPDQRDSIWRQWWLWTVVGVGAAVVAGGTWAYWSFDDNDAASGLRVRAQWSP